MPIPRSPIGRCVPAQRRQKNAPPDSSRGKFNDLKRYTECALLQRCARCVDYRVRPHPESGPVNANATEKRHRASAFVEDVERICRDARSVPLCKFRVRVATDGFACAFHVARASRFPFKANEPMLSAFRRTWLNHRMQRSYSAGRGKPPCLARASVSLSGAHSVCADASSRTSSTRLFSPSR